MPDLKVEISKIRLLEPHPNADRLEVAVIKGWRTIVQKGKFTVGDLVVFIPPDAILKKEIHEHLGITKYCAELPKKADGTRPSERRVKAARLRGEPSYGTVMTLWDLAHFDSRSQFTDDDTLLVCPEYNEGLDVTALLEITKWQPPMKSTQGDQEKDHPQFVKYTDIEHFKNHRRIFEVGEGVVVMSKLHGTNCRLGYIYDEDDDGNAAWQLAAGSHKTRRKQFDAKGNECLYWKPFLWYPKIVDMLRWTHDMTDAPVIVYGEIYGSGVQDMTYGMENGFKDFRVFDIQTGGVYEDWSMVLDVCQQFNIPTVPVLYQGPYYEGLVDEYTDGPVAVCDPNDIQGKFKGREGIVIKPANERNNYRLGRVILKSVSVDYLARGK